MTRSEKDFDAAQRLIRTGLTIAKSPGGQAFHGRLYGSDAINREAVIGLLAGSAACGVDNVRYHFSNRSDDSIGVFTDAVDLWEFMGGRSCKSVRSESSASTGRQTPPRLDEFIGPKDLAVPLTGVHYAA